MSEKTKLYRLEALRGFAAFYVVLHHTISAKSVNIFGHNVGFLLRFGQEAVILFFLLSGFVINYSYQRSADKSFGTYFLKRALRIYIPLFAIFFTSYILLAYNAKDWINPELKTLGLNILMLQDWEVVKPNVITPSYMENTPLWSLSYEWWFYMLFFPLIHFFRGSRKHLYIYSIVVVSTLLYVVLPIFPFRIVSYLGIWWTGVYLADLYLAGKTGALKEYVLPSVALVATSAILFLDVLLNHLEGTRLLLGYHPVLELRHNVFAGCVLIGAMVWHRFKWFGFDIIFKPFLILAPVSYAMYISHMPLMANASYLDAVDNPVLEWFMYLSIVLLFSWLVEIVFYNRLKRMILG